jgi:hypothetical protein
MIGRPFYRHMLPGSATTTFHEHEHLKVPQPVCRRVSLYIFPVICTIYLGSLLIMSLIFCLF